MDSTGSSLSESWLRRPAEDLVSACSMITEDGDSTVMLLFTGIRFCLVTTVVMWNRSFCGGFVVER